MVVSLADTLPEAMNQTYADVEKISSDSLFHRKDIGWKDLKEWH